MDGPYLTRQQAREIDRRAVEEFGIPSLLLMENAGRGVADALVRRGVGQNVVVCCGTGNNGGDGFVIARHLDLATIPVRVLLFGDPSRFTADAATQFAILEKTGIAIERFGSALDYDRLSEASNGASAIVDAVLGTGARGEPRPPLDHVIDQLNANSAPKFAVDLPSGLDADTGAAATHTIRAASTYTFVAKKAGFANSASRPFTGEIVVLSIGAPRLLCEQVLTTYR